MLRSTDAVLGMAIEAKDGRIGKVAEVYFDDREWTVRYLVVDTGHWLAGPSVLLSPHAVRSPDFNHGVIPVELTREQVRNAPRSETEPPVSRQFERNYYDYYGYPYYWEGSYAWGGTAYPFYAAHPPALGVVPPMPREDLEPVPGREKRANGDPHLRSVRAVKGYRVEAKDGDLGHIDDFLLDDADWRIRFLGVDTRNWLPGKTVAVPSEWAKDVRWEDSAVAMDHFREEIRNAPGYAVGSPITRELGEQLDAYFGFAPRPA